MAEEDPSTTFTELGNNYPSPPIHPPILLNLPLSDQTHSEPALSNQSMRTSSFAMSDFSDTKSSPQPQKEQNDQHLESTRIRKAYSRPVLPRNKWRTAENSPETESVDYFDEMDFRNTDRYLTPFNNKRKEKRSKGLIFFLDTGFYVFQVRIPTVLK